MLGSSLCTAEIFAISKYRMNMPYLNTGTRSISDFRVFQIWEYLHRFYCSSIPYKVNVQKNFKFQSILDFIFLDSGCSTCTTFIILTQTYNSGIHLPVRLIISHTPHGVAGNMEYWSKHIRPTLITWKPSTSLSGETALQILLSSMCSAKENKAVALSHC
jgi:hypothetical protein